MELQIQILYGNILHTLFKDDTGVSAHVKSMSSQIGRASVGAGYKTKKAVLAAIFNWRVCGHRCSFSFLMFL